jgi:hypothetical protein
MTLTQDLFAPIAQHLKEHVHRLESLLEHAGAGNEGWLKTEIAYALKTAGTPVRSMHGKGPDLCLCDDGSLVELKSGINWDATYVLTGLKYRTPCLFLVGGPRRGSARFLERLQRESRVLACERFSFDTGDWILGLIAPSG